EENLRMGVKWGGPAFHLLKLAGQPKAIYRILARVAGPSVWSEVMSNTYEELSDGRIHFCLKLHKGLPDCPEFFLGCGHMFACLPSLLGCQRAIVHSTTTP